MPFPGPSPPVLSSWSGQAVPDPFEALAADVNPAHFATRNSEPQLGTHSIAETDHRPLTR